MKSFLYSVECLTNLHVGSGDINFNVVDKEVEKDPVYDNVPIIHASGVKGALRDDCVRREINNDIIKKAFGEEGSKNSSASVGGDLKFFDARLLSRTMRADGELPSVQVTLPELVKDYLTLIKNFNCAPEGIKTDTTPALNFNNKPFFCSKNCNVEGEETETFSVDAYKKIFGDVYAVANSFKNYPLPVIARNNLGPNKNLWYEEYVPHGSLFYLIVLAPDHYNEMESIIPKDAIVQFGGNASVGYGYCKMTLIGEGKI